MTNSCTFGKEVTFVSTDEAGTRLEVKTDAGHLHIRAISADGVVVETAITPRREKAPDGEKATDGQFAMLRCLEATIGHAVKDAVAARGESWPMPERAEPRPTPRPATGRQIDRNYVSISVRKQRFKEGAKPVLFADENDTSKPAESFVTDRTIPLATTEFGARMSAARRLNWLRGPQPSHGTWSFRHDGSWAIYDFDIVVNEHGCYVVSIKPEVQREFVTAA